MLMNVANVLSKLRGRAASLEPRAVLSFSLALHKYRQDKLIRALNQKQSPHSGGYSNSFHLIFRFLLQKSW